MFKYSIDQWGGRVFKSDEERERFEQFYADTNPNYRSDSAVSDDPREKNREQLLSYLKGDSKELLYDPRGWYWLSSPHDSVKLQKRRMHFRYNVITKERTFNSEAQEWHECSIFVMAHTAVRQVGLNVRRFLGGDVNHAPSFDPDKYADRPTPAEFDKEKDDESTL